MKLRVIASLLLLPTLVAVICADSFARQKAIARKTYKEAKALVENLQCYNCHMIGGKGGTIAPPLDGIGRHRTEAYIIDRLLRRPPGLEPNYPVPEELMYHLGIKDPDARLIAEYLGTLPEIPGEFSVKDHGKTLKASIPPGSHFVPLPASESTGRGMKLYKDRGCVACHSIGPVGGHIGPNMAGVGARRSIEFIKSRLSTGAVLLPKPGQTSTKYSMPPSKLSKYEIEDLTNFLLTLPAQR